MFSYPKIITLDQTKEAELVNFIDQELQKHLAERANFLEDLIRWQKDYWAEPSLEVKSFPFRGAASLIIPLTAIAVEAVHARIMTTSFALDQFVELKLPPAFDDIDRELEDYIDKELKGGCDIYKVADNASLEFTKFGTAVVKNGWEKTVKTIVRYDSDDNREEVEYIKQGPVIDAVPLANFLMPFAEKDPQTALWCGEEFVDTPHGIQMKELTGLFQKGTYDKLQQWVTLTTMNIGDKYRTEVNDLQNTQPVMPSNIGWCELYLSWDTDGSGVPKEIVVHYHRMSRTIMSLRYNWFENGRRPYRKAVYFPLEHKWYGFGVCKQNEQFQRSVTTQHRQRLDNATLANMRMIKVSKMSNYGPNEPVFPGKIWLVDEKDDIETFQLGEIYPSSYNNESSSLNYAQQRTGINEVNLGMPQVGTPGTATSDLTRVQEGSRKFDYTYKNFRELLRVTSRDTVKNIAQFGFRDADVFTFMEQGDKVQQFFKLPYRLLDNESVFDLQLAGQNQNKVLNRQNWINLAQMMQQYYGGMIQIAQMTGDQNLIQMLAKEAMSAATQAFRQVLETFDVRNIDRLIIDQLINRTNESLGIDPSMASQINPMMIQGQGMNPMGMPSQPPMMPPSPQPPLNGPPQIPPNGATR